MASDEFQVPYLEPLSHHLYLAPLSTKLQLCPAGQVPVAPPGCVRVVCISDSHNEHEGLRLPEGDVLLHAGDVLTESGLRHVRRGPQGHIESVSARGEALFVNFAVWFGQQRFAHKVMIGGNHDLVLQGMGRDRVQEILRQHTEYGECIYLEGEEATVGSLRVYGSPYAAYGSHNNAFLTEDPQYCLNPGVHIVLTHMPGVLPKSSGRGVRHHEELTRPMFQAGPLLHVSGHCHWAHGLYFAQQENEDPRFVSWLKGELGYAEKPKSIPCVVASVCASHWYGPKQLQSSTRCRGDPSDKRHGGYNLVQPGIICDLHVPVSSAPPSPSPAFVAAAEEKPSRQKSKTARPRSVFSRVFKGCISSPESAEVVPEMAAEVVPVAADLAEVVEKPNLLFFCPSDDADLVRALLPRLQEIFFVDFVRAVDEGKQAVAVRSYAACVSKLGPKGNLGKDIIETLRQAQGSTPFVAIHSATAAADEGKRAKLEPLGVNLFVQYGQEHELLAALTPFGQAIPNKKWPLLLFAPPNDPGFVELVVPYLAHDFCVDVVDSVADGVQKVRDKDFAACLAKLGTAGNLGSDVILALRGEQGSDPIVAIHSSTVMQRPEWRMSLSKTHGVSLYGEHGGEPTLICQLIRKVAATDLARALRAEWLV